MDENLVYEKRLVVIVDRQVKKLCSKEVSSIKAIWEKHREQEVMWELKQVV